VIAGAARGALVEKPNVAGIDGPRVPIPVATMGADREREPRVAKADGPRSITYGSGVRGSFPPTNLQRPTDGASHAPARLRPHATEADSHGGRPVASPVDADSVILVFAFASAPAPGIGRLVDVLQGDELPGE
jgi:hypothetical protein